MSESALGRTFADVNAVVGGYLRDLAFAQSSQQKMFGYKRAAAAILALDVPLTDLVGPDGALPRISGIGPGSTRVIREILDTGESPTVEQAIERSDRRADIERRRQLRRHFLSRAEVRRVLSDPSFAGPTLQQYRGDLQMHSEWSDGYSDGPGDCRCLSSARLSIRGGHRSFVRTEDRRRDVDGRSRATAESHRRGQRPARQSVQAVAGHRSEHRRRGPAGPRRRRGGHLRRGAGRAAFAAAKERGSDRPHADRHRASGGPDSGPPARSDHRIARGCHRQLGRGVCIGRSARRRDRNRWRSRTTGPRSHIGVPRP